MESKAFYVFHCHDIKLAIFTFFNPINTGKLPFKRNDTTQRSHLWYLVNISVYGLVRHFRFDSILGFTCEKYTVVFQDKFLHFCTIFLFRISVHYSRYKFKRSITEYSSNSRFLLIFLRVLSTLSLNYYQIALSTLLLHLARRIIYFIKNCLQFVFNLVFLFKIIIYSAGGI